MMFTFLKLVNTIFSYLIPVNKELYIFGSWFGTKFSDNPKYFYLYLLKKYPEKRVYWYTKDYQVFLELKTNGFPVLYGKSIFCYWLHLRASIVFFSCSAEKDIWGATTNHKTKFFNLWHGTPIKKIGYDAKISGVGLDRALIKHQDNKEKPIKKILKKIIKPILKKEYYILSPSKEIAPILKSAFRESQGKPITIGYPKLDHLFKNKSIKSGYILYTPTYRGSYNSEYDILKAMKFDFKTVSNWLEINNFYLDIKLHPANSLPIETINEINKNTRIKMLSNIDIYQILGDYEYLITDFSSIYFDALALGIKSIIAPFRINEYLSEDRELYFNINEIFPYKLSYTWNDLIKNFDSYSFDRNDELQKRFYSYLDGQSCDRLFTKISNLN